MTDRGAPAELALVRRGGFDESRHFGDVIVLDGDGKQVLALGDVEAAMLPRSTLKPVQAETCLDGGAPLEGPEVTLAAASHAGQDFHVEAVDRILARVGLDREALGCPPDWPDDEDTHLRLAAAGGHRERVRMNCSGKHAAMVATCVVNDWDVAGYLDPEHPLQLRVRAAVERATGQPVNHVTVDGCGAPLLGVTLHGLARVYHRLATAPGDSTPGRIAASIREYPQYLAGDGRPNTVAMQLLPGLIAKGGAEGVLAMCLPDGTSVAVKITDGGSRAATMIALTALAKAGADLGKAAELLDVPVKGGGQTVGAIVPGSDFA